MTGAWERLDRRGLWVSAAFMTGVAILAGVPTAIGLSDISWAVALAWTLPGAAVIVAAGVIAEWLRLRVTRYRVGPDRVELHTGVLVRTRRSLQRDRIRTVDVVADPLLRVFGLVAVRIGTGEQADDGTVKLSPVTRDTGDALRRALLSRAASPASSLAVLDPAWIRYAPLSFVGPVLGGSALGGVLNVADWFGASAGVVDWAIDLLGGLGLIGGIAVLIVVALVVGTIGALGLWVEFWWSYRLDR
ncbi:PH domain-containing protein [Actinoplanes sp. NPDC051470]|uniref:PH domain-containing protein n=1 Tax=Actinoplanes sp. NPDC051470 TaxID=3157224 RepID=UPI003414293C